MEKFFTFVLNHWILSFAFIFLIVLLLMDTFKRRLLGFKEIEPPEMVRRMNNEDAIVLDVREAQEFADGHIANALHIPVGVLDKRLDELEAHKDKPIVVYCRSGDRAARASATLRKQGFNTVFKLNGGILAWKAASLPVQK
jgi:rhodanese-related sulfurtransferase